jgi:hypothetical protein
MKIGISLPTEQFLQAIKANSDRLRDAAYKSLNSDAQDVQEALRKEMIAKFYRVTPYILNSTTIDWAKRDKLEATVGFRDKEIYSRKGTPSEFIRTQVNGGVRRQKASEVRIQWLADSRIGTLYMMPARFAKYDNWGNPDKGELSIILSQLGVLNRGDNRASRTGKRSRKARTEYFAIFGRGEGLDLSGNALAPGIYRRNAAGRPLPVYFFMKRQPQYAKRLDWHEVARATIQAKAQANWKIEVAAALAR